MQTGAASNGILAAPDFDIAHIFIGLVHCLCDLDLHTRG